MNLVVSEDESSLEYVGATTNKGASTANGAPSTEGLKDEVIDHDKRLLNKTTVDEFLSKICPPEGENGNHEVENEDVETRSIFNPDLQWKRKVLVLQMKFESPKQLKNMLCNYVVANGYHPLPYYHYPYTFVFASSIQQQQT
ncbi:unnamed protein product [Lactuca virosa]|uniref:Uncharacterized protein n=1 Tax=Lactuca virosa TaxID=75947 RepID=A0AAU9PHK1_9ASTR|nr:unnamed protein product [Lactuca virosa]